MPSTSEQEAFEFAHPPPRAIDWRGVSPLAGESHADVARRFHEQNPHVYKMAVDLARYMKRRGLNHYGIAAVWEVLRFKYFETTGDEFKLNNNYRAFYARLIAAQEPDLAGFFQLRELRT